MGNDTQHRNDSRLQDVAPGRRAFSEAVVSGFQAAKTSIYNALAPWLQKSLYASMKRPTAFMMLFPVIFSILALVGRSCAVNYCPLLGAVYPAPQNISSNALAKSAVASLTAALDQAVGRNKTAYGEFSSASNSFSINVVSANEDRPIFQYQHTASQLDNASTTAVTGDTMFRIGSISKLFTVFALLLQEGTIIFDDPVTKYIPELADIAKTQITGKFDPVSQVAWKDVTIGALASHLAGIGRDCE